MILKAYWTDFAENVPRTVFDSFSENVNKVVVQKIVLKIVTETKR